MIPERPDEDTLRRVIEYYQSLQRPQPEAPPRRHSWWRNVTEPMTEQSNVPDWNNLYTEIWRNTMERMVEQVNTEPAYFLNPRHMAIDPATQRRPAVEELKEKFAWLG